MTLLEKEGSENDAPSPTFLSSQPQLGRLPSYPSSQQKKKSCLQFKLKALFGQRLLKLLSE